MRIVIVSHCSRHRHAACIHFFAKCTTSPLFSFAPFHGISIFRSVLGNFSQQAYYLLFSLPSKHSNLNKTKNRMGKKVFFSSSFSYINISRKVDNGGVKTFSALKNWYWSTRIRNTVPIDSLWLLSNSIICNGVDSAKNENKCCRVWF